MGKTYTRDELQATGERAYVEQILEEPGIQDVIDKYDEQAEKAGARRHLLATSLRLTEQMAPDIHEMVDSCRKTLGIDTALEIYVYPELAYNAAAVRPEGGRLFVMFSAGLLEGFENDELKFVVGHELGHHLFEHHKIPTGALLPWAKQRSPGFVLRLFAWQRYAEISSDRAGMVCTGGLSPAARALFKLASGLRGDRVKIRVDQFLAQVGDLQKEYERLDTADGPVRSDWFTTHPFSPLRLWAIDAFAKSELIKKGGTPRKKLEQEVDTLIRIMDPSYLQEKSEMAEAMRRLLFAGAVLIAAADGELAEEALKALEKLLGPGSVPRNLNAEAIGEDLPRRIERANEVVPPLRRAQVMRDLCVIAGADEKVTENEKAVLFDLSEALSIDKELVSCALGE